MDNHNTIVQMTKLKALGKVTLSENFRQQMSIWADGCILRGYDKNNPELGLIDIPGQKFLHPVHKQDFEIIG